MVTIGQIPRKTQAFFRPLRTRFSPAAWDHFWGLVLGLCIAHGSTIDRLAKCLRGSTHRTNHGEFLWRSVWNEPARTTASCGGRRPATWCFPTTK